MLGFDPENPFPLVKEDSHNYFEAQMHSALVDQWLGFSTDKIESDLSSLFYENDHDDVQIWKDLSVQAMQTPYTELRFILDQLNLPGGSTILDLGCSNGRMGFVIGRNYPDLHFRGGTKSFTKESRKPEES